MNFNFSMTKPVCDENTVKPTQPTPTHVLPLNAEWPVSALNSLSYPIHMLPFVLRILELKGSES